MVTSAMDAPDLELSVFTENHTPRSLNRYHMILLSASFPVLTITYKTQPIQQNPKFFSLNSYLHQGSNSLIQCPGHYGGLIKVRQMFRTYITLRTPHHMRALGPGHPQKADGDGGYEMVLQFQVLHRIKVR